jgi:Fe-S oxidoreductase
LDIRDFIGKLQQGRFNAAYKTYQQTVGFPGIVASLCTEPCKDVCPMKDAGGAISIKMLEKASIEYARSKAPDQYNMPQKNKRIAIIGAGISGLACALRLAAKKYQVTIFEKSNCIGGRLNNHPLTNSFLDDINLQFANETYELHLNSEIKNLESLDFDAVYVATGKNGNRFGLERSSAGAFAGNKAGIFLGGSLLDTDTMHAIAHGLNAVNAIERYLKIGAMNQPEEERGTKLIYEAIRIIPSEIVIPGNKNNYTKEEAVDEAKRCLKCTCDACNHYSPLMSYFRKFPKKITEEVEISINPSSLDGCATVATRLMSTCTHCGLCKEVCPMDIDTGEFLLQSHRTMREKGKMPWAFHEFYLRDMEFANNDAALLKLPPGGGKSIYMFFPGCQLGASDPRYVIKSYEFLTKRFPGTALMLQCCGAAAEWAGDDPLHREVIEQIRNGWKSLGEPTAIFACPSCKQMFNKYLPEIKGEFLYNLFDETNTGKSNKNENITVSIFDPCAGRNENELQDKIRALAVKAGFNLQALSMERNMAQCCSYGGHIAIAHPPYAEDMVQKRITQNDNPFITYCSNCRDIFARAGKPVWHILDILFSLEKNNNARLTVSQRRNNRMELKQKLLNEFWKEPPEMKKQEKEILISDELKIKLDKQYILESDIYAVILNCEETGMKLYDSEKETFAGHKEIGNMTYWVEYRIMQDKNYELVNAYCHRMKIEGI